jgi:hypothetical protein
MWGLWLALDCLDNEAAAAGVLIFSDSQWSPNALKESGHSAHSILAPLRARLRGLKSCVCFQWVSAHCGDDDDNDDNDDDLCWWWMAFLAVCL